MTGILCSLPLIGAPTSASSGATPMAVSLNKSSVSSSGTSASLTTDSVRATASGGTGPYSYAWAFVSGDTSITASSAGSANTSFQRSSCVAGNTYTGNWKCTATDTATGATQQSNNVSVTIARTASGGGGGGGSTLAASASPSLLSTTGSTSVISTSASTVTPSGGSGSYTYQWIQVSGDASITAVTPTSASTTFRRASCVSGTDYASTWKCTVDDGSGTADTNTVEVDIVRS